MHRGIGEPGTYVGIAFMVLLVTFALRYGYGVVAKPMATELSLSNEQVGAIASAYFLIYAASTPIAGFLADVVSVRAILAGFMAMMGFGSFLTASCGDFYSCVLAYALVGAGSGAGWAPMATLSRRVLPRSRRGLTLGIIDSGSSVGFFMASLLPPLLLEGGYSWRLSWIIWGILSLIVAIAAATSMPGMRGGQHLSPLRGSKVWIIAASYMMFGSALAIPLTFVVKFGVEEMGMVYAAAAMIAATIALSSIPGKIAISHVSDRYGRHRILATSLLLLAVGIALTATFRSPMTSYIFAIMIGLGYGGAIPIYAAMAADTSEMAGTVLGMWTVFFSLGYATTSWAAGRLTDIAGSYIPSFILAAGLACTAALLILVARILH